MRKTDTVVLKPDSLATTYRGEYNNSGQVNKFNITEAGPIFICSVLRTFITL